MPSDRKSVGKVKGLVVRINENEIDYVNNHNMIPVLDGRLTGPGFPFPNLCKQRKYKLPRID